MTDEATKLSGGLWTKRDLAAYLGVNVRTVERMHTPRILITGSGKRPLVRFDPEQVRAWVDAMREAAT